MIQNIKLLFFIEAMLATAVFIFYACSITARNIVNLKTCSVIIAIPLCGIFFRDRTAFYIFLGLIPLLAFGNARKLAGIYLLILTQFPALSEPYGIGSHYLFQFSAVYAFNLGAFIALMTVKRVKPRHAYHLDAACWLFYLVCWGFSVRGMAFNDVLRGAFQTFLNIIPPYYVLSRTLRTEEDASEAMMCLVLGALCNATVGIFEAFHHWPLYETLYSTLGMPLPELSGAVFMRGGFMQAAGAVDNSAVLSLLTGFAIIPCLALKGRFNPIGRGVLITILASGMVAAASRGGWVAAGAALALYWLYTRRFALLGLLGGTTALGWGVVVFLLPKTGRIGDLLGRSGHAQSTIDYRSSLFHRGVEEVGAHPLLGQSLDELQVSMNDLRQGQHIIDFVNTHLFVALTLGVGGLLVWIIAWVIPPIAAWNARATRSPYVTQPPIETPVAILGAVFVALAFTSTIDRMLPFASMSFGMMSAFISINRARFAEPKDRISITTSARHKLVYQFPAHLENAHRSRILATQSH